MFEFISIWLCFMEFIMACLKYIFRYPLIFIVNFICFLISDKIKDIIFIKFIFLPARCSPEALKFIFTIYNMNMPDFSLI